MHDSGLWSSPQSENWSKSYDGANSVGGGGLLQGAGSPNKIRAETVTATFRQSGGMLDDVNALFKGGRPFDGAMRELRLGYGGEHRRLGVKGTIRVGAFLRSTSQLSCTIVRTARTKTMKTVMAAPKVVLQLRLRRKTCKKYQLYCHVLHGKGIREVAKASLKVGNYVPGLQWMNRVGMKVQDTSVFTNYVLKTSGPIWREIISLEVSNISQRAVRLRMYQCSSLEASSLAANTLNRFVGEVSIPLSLIPIVSPSGKPTRRNETANHNSTAESDAVESDQYYGYNSPAQRHRSRGRVDPSLHAAAAEDELLSSVDLRDIPQPSMMPLVFSWEEKGNKLGSKYKRHNGELMMSIWMVPKGGSLFGDMSDDDIINAKEASAEKPFA